MDKPDPAVSRLTFPIQTHNLVARPRSRIGLPCLNVAQAIESFAHMQLKSTFLTVMAVLFFAPVGLAVGFRFIDDAERLKTLGFQISAWNLTEEVTCITISPPAQFEVDKELGSKPFLSLALHDVTKPFPVSTATFSLTLPQASYPVACTRNKEGRLETTIKVLPTKSDSLFLVFTFMHDVEGQWPILIYVPVSGIISRMKKTP
jgi:hypothetical protein